MKSGQAPDALVLFLLADIQSNIGRRLLRALTRVQFPGLSRTNSVLTWSENPPMLPFLGSLYFLSSGAGELATGGAYVAAHVECAASGG